MKLQVKHYLSEIGKQGGKKSRRRLNPLVAQSMVKVREARRAYVKFYASCFWSFDPGLRITVNDLPWVIKQLQRNGNREAWEVASRLCR